GSIGKDYSHLDEWSYKGSERTYEQLVEQGPSPDIPLADQFRSLLRHFPSGAYRLTLDQIPPGVGWLDWDISYQPLRSIVNYYPWSYPGDGKALVPSQPEDRLDADRILHFMERIEAGERPLMVTATVEKAWCEFVLDGHHKAMAYFELRI